MNSSTICNYTKCGSKRTKLGLKSNRLRHCKSTVRRSKRTKLGLKLYQDTDSKQGNYRSKRTKLGLKLSISGVPMPGILIKKNTAVRKCWSIFSILASMITSFNICIGKYPLLSVHYNPSSGPPILQNPPGVFDQTEGRRIRIRALIVPRSGKEVQRSTYRARIQGGLNPETGFRKEDI